MTRTREQINADLAEAARELQRITRSMKTLEDGGATGTYVYRKLRDELPAAQQRHAELVAELAKLNAPSSGVSNRNRTFSEGLAEELTPSSRYLVRLRGGPPPKLSRNA